MRREIVQHLILVSRDVSCMLRDTFSKKVGFKKCLHGVMQEDSYKSRMHEELGRHRGR